MLQRCLAENVQDRLPEKFYKNIFTYNFDADPDFLFTSGSSKVMRVRNTGLKALHGSKVSLQGSVVSSHNSVVSLHTQQLSCDPLLL